MDEAINIKKAEAALLEWVRLLELHHLLNND